MKQNNVFLLELYKSPRNLFKVKRRDKISAAYFHVCFELGYLKCIYERVAKYYNIVRAIFRLFIFKALSTLG